MPFGDCDAMQISFLLTVIAQVFSVPQASSTPILIWTPVGGHFLNMKGSSFFVSTVSQVKKE